jgi:hypothetical protein
MASRFSICFSLFILAYCVTYSSAAVTSWQEEFEIKMEAKMNKIETKNVQLESSSKNFVQIVFFTNHFFV